MANSYIPIPIETIKDAEELPSRTYRLDTENGCIYGKIDGLEAVNQAIRKAILTPRFRCLIYDNQYGSEIEDVVIATDVTRNFVEAVMEGLIKDALKPDTRVLTVKDVKITWGDDYAIVTLTAETIFGETTIQEVF